MFAFSDFKHEWNESVYSYSVPRSNDYAVKVNGVEVPTYSCRVSAYPLNVWWRGHQRPFDQTESASYVNLVADEPITVEVTPLTKSLDGKIMIKPYSKNVRHVVGDGKITFTLDKNGGYIVEIGDCHGLLYVFSSAPEPAPKESEVTYYFGSGVHFPGKITLKSNESVYVDRNALVYGCIFAKNAENVKIFGNGIFDDSGEERFCEHCYEPYTNGNIKLYECKNVTVRGVGFTNSAIWCVNVFACEDVLLDGIKVFGQWRYNTDGTDIVNSKRVTVRNSFIHSFDDAIVIKGIDRYMDRDCEDITVEGCALYCDWGRTCEIGFETSCREIKRIAYRDCDILRGGNTAMSVHNGDCAAISGVRYSDIRLELENFYTPEVYQTREEDVYNARDALASTRLIEIFNPRFRAQYDFLYGISALPPYPEDESSPRFASVTDVVFDGLTVYCDETLIVRSGGNPIKIGVANFLPNAEFSNVTAQNVVLAVEREDGSRDFLPANVKENLTVEGNVSSLSIG